MDQVPIEEKKSFLHNDRLLVCSMLAFYGICIVGLVAAVVWGLNRRGQAIAANAAATSVSVTSTAAAPPTPDEMRTATVSAHQTEQAQYQMIDPFDNNKEQWWITTVNDENMTGSIKIIGGTFRWDIQKVKQPFVDWSAFHYQESFEDFDVYVDSKIADQQPGDACSGLVFRSVYIFSVCSDSTFNVYYYKNDEWESISRNTPSSAIQNSAWNRLEISARGNEFNLLINDEVVYQMTDDRQSAGWLALYIETNAERPMSISFDNFGLQPR